MEYWPSVVFGRSSLCSVRTATTSGQYSPVQPLRLINKRLLAQSAAKASGYIKDFQHLFRQHVFNVAVQVKLMVKLIIVFWKQDDCLKPLQGG